jgi:hypothetical protein
MVDLVCHRKSIYIIILFEARPGDLAANCSPASMALIKHQVLTDLDASYEQSMRRAYRAMAVLAQGPDFREGIDSFIQKRPPEFLPLRADLNPADITGADLPALTIDPKPLACSTCSVLAVTRRRAAVPQRETALCTEVIP